MGERHRISPSRQWRAWAGVPTGAPGPANSGVAAEGFDREARRRQGKKERSNRFFITSGMKSHEKQGVKVLLDLY
jgi:hypothetical protein